MKKLLTILCLILLVSCSNEVPSDKLVERQGITYEVNTTKPFTGSSVEYYENGQLRIRIHLKDGKQEGLWEYFSENGQLEERANFKDGKEDGLYESYYENGQLEERANFKDGKRDGLYESYYENGQPEYTRKFKNGVHIND